MHYTTSCNTQSSVPEDGQNNCPKHVELTGIINKALFLHLVGCLYYLYQWCTIKQIRDNEIYLLIEYIKSVLWRTAKRLSYIEDACCLTVILNNFHFQLLIGACSRVEEWIICCIWSDNIQLAVVREKMWGSELDWLKVVSSCGSCRCNYESSVKYVPFIDKPN